MSSPRFILLGVAALLVFAASSAGAIPSAEEVARDAGFQESDRARVMRGEIVTANRPSSSERELAISMAFLVRAPSSEIVPSFKAAGDYEVDDDVLAFGTIQGEGSLEDFAGLRLEPGGEAVVRRFIEAKPGSELNLDASEIAALNALEGRTGADAVAAVEAELRKMLLARYRAYRAQGLAGIPPYVRSGGRPFDAGAELRGAVEASILDKYAPAFYRALLDYPNEKPSGLREEFLWVNFRLDNQPTFTLTHRLALDLGEGTHAVADRSYYVSRSHNSVQVVGGLFPVEEGTIVFYGNRTSTDQVTGFGASGRRSIGRRVMSRQIRSIFQKVQGLYENP